MDRFIFYFSFMKKILIISIVFLSSITTTFATDIDPIAQTKALLDQYASRVRFLEAENAILREEMRKAGIKIPLDIYSGAIQTNLPPTSVVVAPTTVIATGTTSSGVIPANSSIETAFSNIEKLHGTTYGGVIRRLVSEWSKVREAYAMPKNAYIGGYEFVISWALDHVFVDIMYTGSIAGTGFYDAKILYQFDKTTFARKLIGFFEYNSKTGYYITKTGKNIFPGVKRTWIEDPRISNGAIPSTVNGTGNPTGATPTPSASSTVSYADIEAAYTAKRFLSVITLSNNWLAVNPPTLDVLRIRYRTYFIIAKYSEALKEIEKIRSLGQLSSAVACEGYVIATYAKDTTLADSYKVTCNKK